MSAEESEDTPYRIDIDQQGCETCRAQRTYTIVAPDGVALGRSWDDMNEALELCDELNAAHNRGLAEGKAEIDRLRANWENEKQHVLDMREGVRLGGELAKEVERLRGFIQQQADKLFAAAKHHDETGSSQLRDILLAEFKRFKEALLPPSPTPNLLDEGDSQ